MLLICCLLAGCSSETDGFDYANAYDRVSKDVIEQGYAVEELTEGALKKFSSDDVCVCLGDSITGLMDEPKDYPSVIESETGLTVINGGFGGCRMAYHPYPEYDAFSMYRLADAIATGDWTLQDTYVSQVSESAGKRYDALKAVDWKTVDIITIAYGTNDINAKTQIDDSSAPLSTATFLGAMRYSIERITTAYPHIKIMIITPVYRYWTEDGTDVHTRDFDGHSFVEWVDGMIRVAEEYSLPCVDLYRTSGLNSVNRSMYYTPNDGVHPNELGLELIGKKIAAALMYHY